MQAVDGSEKAVAELVMQTTEDDDTRLPLEAFVASSGLDSICPRQVDKTRTYCVYQQS